MSLFLLDWDSNCTLLIVTWPDEDDIGEAHSAADEAWNLDGSTTWLDEDDIGEAHSEAWNLNGMQY